MTAPQIIERELTFSFAPTVQSTLTTPQVVDIAIIPLSDASSYSAGATFVSGVQSAQVELVDPINQVTFSLVPSYAPGLTNPINYRVLWRIGINSRTFTYDFVMPDQDLTWEQLSGTVANIISGDAYLQPSDLGVPNGIARLDGSGNVLNSQGIICATESDISQVDELITQETVNREAADATLQANLQSQIVTQAQSILQSAEVYTDHQVVRLSAAQQAEVTNRVDSEALIKDSIAALQSTLSNNVNLVQTQANANTQALGNKADLIDGFVPINELPTNLLITTAVAVPNQQAMLGLLPSLVSPGDIAVQPTGSYLLMGDDPAVMANWILLSPVQSVNGKTGNITLTAGDLNALPANQQIPESQVIGLENDLKGKVSQLALDSWAAQVQAVQSAIGASGPGAIVTLNSNGEISSTLLDSGVAYINSLGQITNKSGVVVATGGGGTSGGVTSLIVGDQPPQVGQVTITASLLGALTPDSAISWTQLRGIPNILIPAGSGGLVEPSQIDLVALSSKLTAKADLVTPPGGGSPLVPLSEIPAIPADQITVDVHGNTLATLLTGNQLSVSSNLGNIATEALVNAGHDGGGGPGTETVYFVSTVSTENTEQPGNNPWPNISMSSPWGIDTTGKITGTVGSWYFLASGVQHTDVAFPTMSANGHLRLTQWDEAAPPDPTLASESFVTSLTSPLSAAITTIQDQQNINTGNISTLVGQQTISSDNINTLQTQAAQLNSVVLNGGTVTPNTGNPYTLATSSDIASINANLVANYATSASVTGVIGKDLSDYVQTGTWTAQQWATFQTVWPTVSGWIGTAPWTQQGYITDADVPQISVDVAENSLLFSQSGNTTTVTASTFDALTPASEIPWSQIGTSESPVPDIAVLNSAGLLAPAVIPLSGQVNLKTANNLEGLVTNFVGVASGSSISGSGNEVSTGNICVVYDTSDPMQCGVFILTGTNAGVLDTRNAAGILTYAANLSPSISSGPGGWLEVTNSASTAITSIMTPSGVPAAIANGQATITTADLGTLVTSITANGTALANTDGVVNITPATIGALPSANLSSEIDPLITAYGYLSIQAWGTVAPVTQADYVATVAIETVAGGYTPQPTGIYSLNSTDSNLMPPPGSVVLLTAQSNSAFNGLWTVGSVGSEWTQLYPQSLFKPGIAVVVTNQSNGPTDTTVHATSIWVQTATEGTVGGSPQTWNLATSFSPPLAFTGSGGIDVTGTSFTTSVGTGLSNSNNELSIVPNEGTYGVAQSWTSPIPLSSGDGWSVEGTAFTYVPSGPSLTNPYPTVQVWSTSAGINTLVLTGVSVTEGSSGTYEVTIYFQNAPNEAGQYVLSVVG